MLVYPDPQLHNTLTSIDRFVGIEVERQDHPEWERAVLVLSKPNPVLCYPISGKTSRVLVDVPNSKHISTHLQEVSKSLPSYLRPSYEASISQAKSTVSMPNQVGKNILLELKT